ncbi:hypothetical protein [Symbiobacterium terraclitae]|jgi:hypothetical protein|uniref:hypothetical protein n=1 Tax=Symbiobacterium terraclitae TaxID=557451 RepID=UPI0035B4FFE9
MTDREMRKALRAVVTKAVNRADPVYLLEMGAPDDEYEPEILSRIDGLADAWPDQQKVLQLCEDVFIHWFGPQAPSRRRLKRLAAELVRGLNALARSAGTR